MSGKRTKSDFHEALSAAPGKPQPRISRAQYENLLASTSVLRMEKFADLKWIVPDILPEGCTILAGRPKVGKSWLALDIAIAVASGGDCLGKRCEQGAVLALFLEDNKRRLQRRMTTMLGVHRQEWPDITYATEWRRLHEGGIEYMKRWIDETVQAGKKPRLIIVDILQRVRKPAGNRESQYAADYEAVVTMQALASEAQISILVLHHQRKMAADDPMDTLSGTLGLAGGADGALVLGKEQDGSKYIWGNGRDSVAGEFKISVQQDERLHWENLGPKLDDVGSEQRAQIIAALAKAAPRPMSLNEITKAVDGKKPNVKRLIYKLRDAGIIETVGVAGVFRLPVEQPGLI